jgi:hypothetical protein
VINVRRVVGRGVVGKRRWCCFRVNLVAVADTMAVFLVCVGEVVVVVVAVRLHGIIRALANELLRTPWFLRCTIPLVEDSRVGD